MKRETIIYNQRPVEMPAGSDLKVWCHLAPFGEFKRRVGKQDVIQRCDKKAFEGLIANFKPEVLVDHDHKSDFGETVASGWAQELRIGDDGLEVLIDFTDTGAETVRNRRFRYLSPAWTINAQGYPVKLGSIALTNKPFFDLRPVLNMDDDSPAAGAGQQNQQQKGIQNMDTKQIALALGLAEDATAEEILAAINAARDTTASLEKRIKELEDKQLAEEAETVANSNAGKIANKDEFKKLYVANKDFTLQMLGTIKNVSEPRHVTNSATAKPPAAFTGRPVKNLLNEYEAMPEGAEKRQFLRNHTDEINNLRNAATAQ